MSNVQDEPEDRQNRDLVRAGDRLIYILPADGREEQQVNIADLWNTLKGRKWQIAGVTLAFVVFAGLYAFSAEEWYRAEVLLVPASADSSPGLADRLGGLGGLASLAGISVGGSERAESIATLRSRDLTRTFIQNNNLIKVILHDEWDDSADRWKAADPDEHPDIRDATKFFQENVLSVTENAQNGLVILSIEWTDPRISAKWASELVALVNLHTRERALSEATRNIEYLQEQLTITNVATLRESIGALLESELQKLMLAKGNTEFAFRVIDKAQIPKDRVRPKRGLIVVLGFAVGGMVAVLLALVPFPGTRDAGVRRS